MGLTPLEGKARVTEVTKRAGQLWNESLPDEDKKPYDQATELKEKYDVDMYNWKTGSNNSVVPDSPPTPKVGVDQKVQKISQRTALLQRKQIQLGKESTPEPEEEVVRVEKFEHNGTTYLLDKSNGDLYDQETQDIVGKKTSDGIEMFE